MPETLFRGTIVTVERLERRWEVVRHAPAVAVLVRDGERVLGVRQHRPAVASDTWELPAGLIDPGETPEQAALRELAEEVRLRGRLEPLARFHTSPGFTDEIVHLFQAFDLEPAFAERDEGEQLSIEWRSASEVWHEAAAGGLATSAVTLLGLRHALAELGVEVAPKR